MKLNLLILIYSVFVISCNYSSNRNDTKPFSINQTLVDTTESVNELFANEIKVDSNKLIKAFDNIYFGKNSKRNIHEYSKKEYSISYIQLNFDPEEYSTSDNFGLYKFRLVGHQAYEYDALREVIHEIKAIIEASYSNVKKIKEIIESPYGIMGRRLQAFDTGTKKIPKDYLNEVFEYEFIKNNISIKVGYEISYRIKGKSTQDLSYENNFKNNKSLDLIKSASRETYYKICAPIITFTYLPEFLSIQKTEDSIETKLKKEERKRDVLKF